MIDLVFFIVMIIIIVILSFLVVVDELVFLIQVTDQLLGPIVVL